MARYYVITPDGRLGFDFVRDIKAFISLDADEVKRLSNQRHIITKDGVEIFNMMNW